jgi:hypothetical protein
MLQHFVFIKYHTATAESHIEEFRRRMLALREVVPGIAHLEVGRDILHDARSWDLVLVMRFVSVEALREYQRHEAHQQVMQFNQPCVADVASVDFFAP